MSFLVRWIGRVTLCCVCISNTFAEGLKTEGEDCTMKDGREGICRIISDCPSVIAMIKVENPINCGFKGNSPIVCCTDGLTSNKPGGSGETQVSTEKMEAKCKEYSKSVTYTAGALPLLPDARPSTIVTAKCDLGELPLIVGGVETKLGEFPHMAAIGYQDGREIAWNCGGSLISEHYVMTAAHCTNSRRGPPVVARLGELNLKRDDDGAFPRDYTISSVLQHPYYKPPAKYNDIGLLRLSQKVQFNKYIRPACLYIEDSFHINKTIATGWGRIGFGQEQSDILLKVGLDIIENEQCDRLYRSLSGTATLPQGIKSTMMCAGVLKGGEDTCQGDSGGPIQIISRFNKCIYHVIGITSFGKFCAAQDAPGVYTRVSQFLPWIVSVVWP